MWKSFKCNEALYMLKSEINTDDDENYQTFYLTDYKSIWMEKSSKQTVLQRFQELNPTLDIKIEDAASHVNTIISNIPEEMEIVVCSVDDALEVTIKQKISCFAVKFKIIFTTASLDLFLEKVTIPLIHTVKYLEEQQHKICDLVEKKDRELEEYRMEKGCITRNDLVTEKFDKSILQTKNEDLMLNVFATSKPLWVDFENKYGRIEAEVLDVKKEEWNNIKRKRKVYSSKTCLKKGRGVDYTKKETV